MLLKRFSLGLQNMKCPLQPSVVKMAGRRWVSMLPGWKLTGRLTESSTSTFPLWRILFHSRPRVCCHYPAAYKPKCCLSCLSSIVLPAVVPFSAPVLWNVSRPIQSDRKGLGTRGRAPFGWRARGSRPGQSQGQHQACVCWWNTKTNETTETRLTLRSSV